MLYSCDKYGCYKFFITDYDAYSDESRSKYIKLDSSDVTVLLTELKNAERCTNIGLWMVNAFMHYKIYAISPKNDTVQITIYKNHKVSVCSKKGCWRYETHNSLAKYFHKFDTDLGKVDTLYFLEW